MRLPARVSFVALAALLLALPGAAQTSAPAPAAAPEGPAAAPSPAPAPSAPAATSEPPQAEKPPPSPMGGYSWSDKPRKKQRAARHARRLKVDPKAPLATYPGFRMLPSGGSTLWVSVSKKVNVDVRRSAGRVSYVLSHAQVGIWNNTNPLVTHYFDTPLSRAWLRPEKGGAELVLELRENVQPKHRVIDGPGGTMILQIDLPRSAKRYAPQQQVMPPDAKKGQILVPNEPRRRRTPGASRARP